MIQFQLKKTSFWLKLASLDPKLEIRQFSVALSSTHCKMIRIFKVWHNDMYKYRTQAFVFNTINKVLGQSD